MLDLVWEPGQNILKLLPWRGSLFFPLSPSPLKIFVLIFIWDYFIWVSQHCEADTTRTPFVQMVNWRHRESGSLVLSHHLDLTDEWKWWCASFRAWAPRPCSFWLGPFGPSLLPWKEVWAPLLMISCLTAAKQWVQVRPAAEPPGQPTELGQVMLCGLSHKVLVTWRDTLGVELIST